MALQERYDLEGICNTSEKLVYERVERLLDERSDFCTCESCVLDLVAFILSRVKPRYRTSLLGDLHPDSLQEKRLRVEIELALKAGLKRLRQHPHHD
jgi:competence protein ComFB